MADDILVAIGGQKATIDVLANDAPGLTVEEWEQPTVGHVTHLGNGVFEYLAPANYYGTDHWRYRTSDGAWHKVWTSVLMVGGVPPVARDDVALVMADADYVEIDPLLNDEDPDAGTLTLVGVTLPKNGKLTPVGGSRLRYTPDPGFEGVDVFWYTIRDPEGNEASAKVTIHVEGARREGLVARKVGRRVKAGESTTLSPGDFVDGDVVGAVFVGAKLVGEGKLSASGGSITYAAPQDGGVRARVLVTVRDAAGREAEGEAVIEVEKAAMASPPPAPVSGDEFPPVRRGLRVRNGDQLRAALAQVRPGDHIVLEDGDYRGYWKVDRGGEPGRPVVIRARNLLGARVGLGVRGIEVAASDLLFWGIDFRDCNWMPINGQRITFRRCRVWPMYRYEGAVGFVPQNCRDVRFEYCTFRLYTTDEAKAISGRSGNLWKNGASYGCVWCYTKARDFRAGEYPRNLVFERIRLEGGPSGVPYGAPNCQFIEPGGPPNVTNSNDYPVNWVLRLIFGDVPRDKTIIDLKASRCTLDRVHIKAPGGSIQVREGWGHVISRCRFEGAYMSIQSRGHRVENVAGRVVLGSGTLKWDDPRPASTFGGWIAATEVDIHHHDGDLVIGWGADWPHAPGPVRVYAHSGPVTDRHPGADVRFFATSQVVREAPVTLTASDVGHDAGWAGTEPEVPTPPPVPVPGDPSPPPPPDTSQELPSPTRVVNVASASELRNAMSAAQPGDHIVLADGVYNGPFYIGALSGTQAQPVVVRAANRGGAKIRYGIRMEDAGASWVVFWGLDVEGVSWVRGSDLVLRRCRFFVEYPGHGKKATALYVYQAPRIRIDYCSFDMEDEDAYRDRTGRQWSPPNEVTKYHSLEFRKWTVAGLANGRATVNAIVHRCHFSGGLRAKRAYLPGQMHILVADRGRATLAPDWRGLDYVTIRLCRVDTQVVGDRCLYSKCSGVTWDRVHAVALRGGAFANMPRHGFGNRAIDCRFEGFRVVVLQSGHVFHNVLSDGFTLYDGNYAPDDVPSIGSGFWNAAGDVSFYNCTGEIRLGHADKAGEWKFVPENVTIVNHSGRIRDERNVRPTVVGTPDPAWPVRDPVTIQPHEVGWEAEWKGADG